MLKTYTQDFRIASYQTDVSARMKPSAVLELMQEMAGAHAEKLNVGRSRLLPMNLAWVLTRVEVRMDRYPLSGETITVETFPMPNRRVFFPRYFISGMQLAAGSAVQARFGSCWISPPAKWPMPLRSPLPCPITAI